MYVTDYTINEALPANTKWGNNLIDKVLKIEMWDAAANFGPTMKQGGFYAFNNCRMMVKNGYLEAKMAEAKIHKLEEERDGEIEAFARFLEYAMFLLDVQLLRLTLFQEESQDRIGVEVGVGRSDYSAMYDCGCQTRKFL